MAKAVWTNAQIIAQLDSGYHLSGSSLTYGFPASASWFPYAEKTGFSALTSAQQTAATLAIKLWDDLITTDFAYTSNGAAATIKYSNTTTDIGYAHAYYPGSYTGASSVWFNSNYGSNSGTNNLVSPTVGQWGFQTYVHETGHALGLDHPGDYNGGSPTYANDALFMQDSQMYSIMSYFTADNTGADWVASDGRTYYAQTPMLYDILTIQAMYGAETTTRVGNTTYGFNATADAWVFDFTQNKHPVLCIYDSAGNDTIDLSGWSYSCTIDLTPGSFSNCDMMTCNLSIAYGAWIENAIGGGGADRLTGNSLGNTLSGLGGNDILDGGAGNDILLGGDGSDQLTGGTGDDTLTGGAGNDTLTGNDGTDTALYSGLFAAYTISISGGCYLVSGEGVDTLAGIEFARFVDGVYDFLLGLFSDPTTTTTTTTTTDESETGVTVFGSKRSDTISTTVTVAGQSMAGDGADTLYGYAGNDSLDGGLGADVMYGGAGNDIYAVDDAGDQVIELIGQGTDLVRTTLSAFTLGDNLERLTYIGSGDFAGTGNALANILTGGAGDDTLLGFAGNDSLAGNDGADTLDGGLGNDTMVGGAGNDTYVVDSTRDRITERKDGGTDLVTTSLSKYALRAYLEDLTYTGSDAFIGTGNASANVITGGTGNDKLSGAAGNDVLDGLAGDDILEGGAGVDTLSGGEGADTFVFRTIKDMGCNDSADTICDFSTAENDIIDLHLIDAMTKLRGNNTFVFIGEDDFSNTAGQLRFTEGLLAGDINGDGTADFEIRLTGVTTLSETSILL
ncbi:M10 family metallopeptidase C-terminal domain-containing protein [Blastochloris sulfoviridis]|nr:M10 family metallopeptidase C-terminal domain-containing protein [Blastochloris sulfoviridis]